MKIDRDANNKIVIYGAGGYATALCRRLQLMKCYEQVAYILVTKKENTYEYLEGKPIYLFEEKRDDLVDKNVIIAVSPSQSEEIHRELQSISVKAVFQMPKEEYRFREIDISELKKSGWLLLERDDYFYEHCIMPRVSIIVPVYNTDRFLEKCLDSILAQTLVDIEVICIDDGSTDTSPMILDNYAQKDTRVIVVHKENRGYGHTINVGVGMARGRYIGIVEGDDYIACNMYERLYSLAVDNDLDIIKAECFFCWDSINYRIPIHVGKVEKYFNKVLTYNDRELFFGFFMNTWSGIYRKEYLMQHGIIHHETRGAAFQDNGFWIQTLYHAQKAMWISDKLYYYRQDNENASVMGDGKVYEMSNEYTWVEDKLIEQGIKEEELLYCYYFHLIRNKGNYYRISDDKKKEFCSRILEDYNKYLNLLDKNNEDHNDSSDTENALYVHKDIEEWYKKIMESPLSFTREVLHMKEYIIDTIMHAEYVYILGISFFAQRIMRILHRINMSDCISAFIDIEYNELSQIGNIPVWNIYYPDIKYKRGVIFIGAPRGTKEYEYYNKALDRFNANMRIDYDDIANNFYWQI